MPSFGRAKLAQPKQEPPLALKMNSRWRCDVEIVFVGRAMDEGAGTTALLAVRQLGAVAIEQPSANISSQCAAMDFHSWAKAFDGKIGPCLESPPVIGLHVTSGHVMKKRSIANSSTDSSLSLESASGHIRRPLKDLRNIRMTLVDGQFLEDFSLHFLSEELQRKGHDNRPDLLKLLVDGTNFMHWLTSSTNSMYNGEGDSFEYVNEICFRPPNSTCASSKVVLSANCATLERTSAEDDDNDVFVLQLHGVSHLTKSTRRCSSKASATCETIKEVAENTIAL